MFKKLFILYYASVFCRNLSNIWGNKPIQELRASDSPHQTKDRSGERGSAALVIMIFMAMAALSVLTYTAANNARQTRNLEKSRLKVNEKWNARSVANILAQVIQKDAPIQMDADVKSARNQCNLSLTLPIFDSEINQSGGINSPAVIFDGANMSCADNPGIAKTSIFGNFSNWRDARIPGFESTAHNIFDLDLNNAKIVQLDEIYRRQLSDSDVAYAVRYIVEAKSGNYRTRTKGEFILGTNLPTCGTSATLEVNPTSVVRGSQVEMNITYAYANKIEIYNSANVLINSKTVAEQSTSQIYVFRFTPASTETYRVTASGSGGCQVTSATVVITVTEPVPVCPRLISFEASSTTINAGETVVLSWNVQDADVVTFEGANVPLTGSQSFTLNETRTFTLTGRDAANSCPFTRQITVTVRPLPPACTFSTPRFDSFTASPASIAVGESSTLSWAVSAVSPGGTIVLSGPNVNQAISPTGSLIVNPPAAPGDYTYTIVAKNTCPDGTVLQTQAIVVISVRSCPPPNITAFTVNPTSVYQGDNQRISFAWTIDGTGDSVSINYGVGGGLPANGTVDVVQPQTTTTYTLTAVGCGQTRQAYVTVTVNIQPPTEPNIFVNISKFENLHYYDASGLVTYYPLVNFSSYVTSGEYISGQGYYFNFNINRNTKQFSVKVFYAVNDYNTFISQNEMIFKIVSSPTPAYPTSPYLFDTFMPSGFKQTNPQNDGNIPCFWDESTVSPYYYHARTNDLSGVRYFTSGLTNPRGAKVPPASCIPANSDTAPDPNSISSSEMQVREVTSPSPYVRVFEYYGYYNGTSDPLLMHWQRALAYRDCSGYYGCIDFPAETSYRYYNSNMHGSSLFADCVFYSTGGANIGCSFDGAVMRK